MKIIQLVSSLGIGGAEKFVVGLSLELASKNHEVQVVVLDRAQATGKSIEYENKILELLNNSGIPVHFMDCKRINVFGIYFRLKKILNSFQPDVVHSHLLIWNLFLSVLNKRFKVVFTQHTNHIKLFIAHQLWLKLRIDDYVAICDEVKIQAEQLVEKSRINKVVNGIDFKQFQNKSMSHKKLNTFIVVARLEPVKNIDLLINAAELLAKQRVDFNVLIVGDGSLKADLERLVSRKGLDTKVNFLGSRSDIPNLLHQSRTFILTSFYEGFSISLIEALAANLDIIATDVGGNSELLDYGRFGHLVESNNVTQLAQAMKESIKSTKVISDSDRSEYLNALSIETCAQKHIDIYNDQRTLM